MSQPANRPQRSTASINYYGRYALSDSKVRCTGWGHVYLQLCIFGVSSVFRCIY